MPPIVETLAQRTLRIRRQHERAERIRARRVAVPVANPFRPAQPVGGAGAVDRIDWFADAMHRIPRFQQAAIEWGQAAAPVQAVPPAPPPEPTVFNMNMGEIEARVAARQRAENAGMEALRLRQAEQTHQAQNPPAVTKIEKEADEMPERLANTFLVGCDPEFVVLDKADTVFNTINAGITARGEVGYDHSGLVLEIRPEAAKGTYALMKRIKQIIDNNDKLKLVSGKKWRAGAVVKTKLAGRDQLHGHAERTLTLGGHVHLDLPPVGYGGVDQELHNIRLSAMDRMTKYLEGLDILPKNESAVRREEGAKATNGNRYGQWGDWRPAGGETERIPVRVEYRTPASWLYSQYATFLTLTGVKLAMVSPQLAIDTLKIKNISYDNLKAFFELYRHKDANARRVLECLLNKNVNQLQADPDRDVREAWKILEF